MSLPFQMNKIVSFEHWLTKKIKHILMLGSTLILTIGCSGSNTHAHKTKDTKHHMSHETHEHYIPKAGAGISISSNYNGTSVINTEESVILKVKFPKNYLNGNMRIDIKKDKAIELIDMPTEFSLSQYPLEIPCNFILTSQGEFYIDTVMTITDANGENTRSQAVSFLIASENNRYNEKPSTPKKIIEMPATETISTL